MVSMPRLKLNIGKLPRANWPDPAELLFQYRRILPWLVLFLSLTLIAVFSWQISRYVARQAQQALHMQSLQLAAGVEQRMRAYEMLLRATGNAFAFVPEIDADFFTSYIRGLELDRRYAGVTGIGWTVPVQKSRITALEQEIREQGDRDFFVWPVTNDRVNYALLYMRPDTEVNRAAIGYNMFSDPVQRRAMIGAFQHGMPEISGPLDLGHEVDQGRRRGFAIFSPVFDATRRRGPEAPSRTAFRGFVHAVFLADELMHGIINHATMAQLDVELYDVTDRKPQLLYDSRPEIWSYGDSDSASTPVSVAGRQWQLVVAPIHPSGTQDLSQRWLIYVLLSSGLLLSVLLTLMTWLMVRSAVRARAALDRQIEQVEIRTILLRELNHRVKNTLATVNSLAALSRQNATDVASYYEALTGRLRALSATHDLLTSSDWSDTELRDIAEAELAPYRGRRGQVVIEGPSVHFEPTKALSFGLSIHELATNAAKYGALSTAEGQVRLSWQVGDDGMLHVRWQETGGPAVSESRQPGFGSMLIEKLMARQLRAEVRLEFLSTGAVCSFRIPMDNLSTPGHVLRRQGLGRSGKRIPPR